MPTNQNLFYEYANSLAFAPPFNTEEENNNSRKVRSYKITNNTIKHKQSWNLFADI